MDVIATVTRQDDVFTATVPDLDDATCRAGTFDRLAAAVADLAADRTGIPAASVRVRFDLSGCFVTSKYVRQSLWQAAVLDKIDREHLPIDTPAAREHLTVLREQVTGPLAQSYLDRWEQLLDADDPALIRAEILTEGDTAAEMRNLSPLGGLLDEPERRSILEQVFAGATPRTST